MPRPEYVTREHWCRGYYQLPGLEIQVGETQTLIPSHRTPNPLGYLFKLADGEIITGTSLNCEVYGEAWTGAKAAVPSWRRTRDGGKTWRDEAAWPCYTALQLTDGEIIHLGHGGLEKTDQQGAYKTRLYRSSDNGYTHQPETVTLTGIPELAVTKEEFGKQRLVGHVSHSIVQLKDETLLGAMHGKFSTDFKFRTFVAQSADRGNTWRYLSTVAFDLDPGEERRMGGFWEPDLLVLPDGEILCFMRTGGTYNATFTPLYLSRSIDSGQSWSHADPIADRGVWPNACLMANGVIAVTCGRTGDWLAFSLDQGQTWLGHFCFHRGPQAYDACNYNWVEEVAPDTLLVAYGRTDPNDCCQSEILGTYITVKRT